MANWLSNRLTPAKLKEARWVELATVLERVWEEFFDPDMARFERLRSTYTADDADLIKKIREMGDYFSFDMPREENRPISLGWRRLELEYKDMELIVSSIFRRHYNNLPVHWLPLYAPIDLPYGARFEVASEFEIATKNIAPEGMFLTSRGLLGADYGYLMTMGFTKSVFLERAMPLIRRAKPLHIVFEGMLWFIRFDLPFEAEISDQLSWAERDWGVIELPFSVLGSRYDYIKADARKTDLIHTLDCNWSRTSQILLAFLPENSCLWHLDYYLPEGFPQTWLPTDVIIPGMEGCNDPIRMAAIVSNCHIPIIIPALPVIFTHEKIREKASNQFRLEFIIPHWKTDFFLPEGLPDWLPTDIAINGCEEDEISITMLAKIHTLNFTLSFITPTITFDHEKFGERDE